MEPSRRQQITERLTGSAFVRNVIGPRVLEPVTVWYETNLRRDDASAEPAATTDTGRPEGGGDATIDLTDAHDRAGERTDVGSGAIADRAEADTATHRSRSLEAARNAERFLAGTTAVAAPTIDPHTTPADDPGITVDAPPQTSSLAGAEGRRSAAGDAPVAVAGPAAHPDHQASPPAHGLGIGEEATSDATGVLGGRARPDADTLAADAHADTATPNDTAVPVAGGLAGIRDIAMRVKARVKHHNLNVVAAGIAFWGLLAIPAVLTATISIYGLVASPDDVERQINDALSGVSEEARQVIGDQLTNITGGNSGGLAFGAVFGIVLALWSASGAIAKMIVTMNTIWEVREDRKFFELRGVAIAITLGAILFFLSTVFLLAIVPALLGETALGDAAKTLIGVGRFPAMLVFMMVGLSFLYWFGPNRDARLRLVTWGALVATIGWLVLSGLFSVYTTYFASYNETYAAMGSIVVLLLWMFITAFMVLVGAEIDAAREERDDELAAAGSAG